MVLSAHDRLLLAFANLASHGIASRPSVPGEMDGVRLELEAELRAKYPKGRGSYVFWLKSDERRLARSGELLVTDALPLYYASESDVTAVAAACSAMGIGIERATRPRELLARDGVRGVVTSGER